MYCYQCFKKTANGAKKKKLGRTLLCHFNVRVCLTSPVVHGSSNNSDNFSFFTRPVLSLSLVTHTHTVTLSNKSLQRTLHNRLGSAFMKHKIVCCRKGMSVVHLLDTSRFLLEINVTVGAVRSSKTKKNKNTVRLREFEAYRTFVRLLPCVDQVMFLKVGELSETLFA